MPEEGYKRVRTRFAPSPTGFMHVGGVRTALFAWLVARQAGGKFILRLEDTDQKREVAGSADHILKTLHALGLEYDEGPDIGGAYGPYRQSDRLTVYRNWAQKLIDSGRAYTDPYTPEELQRFRADAINEKRPFLYRNHRPDNPPLWDGTKPLRFRSEPTPYRWHDEVMGELSAGPEAIDDFILIKSDGFPTYNFAHIVDDAEMHITHVIRGQEFIASQPNYLNLYDALGLAKPVFATMPHILAPSGNRKLSKRDGARDVLDYLSDGYLKEALVNFIATLGWNDGTEQEIYTIEELTGRFSLGRVQKSGARFDENKLLWLNGQWLRRLDPVDLFNRAEGFWPKEASGSDDNYKMAVLNLLRDRLKTLKDLSTASLYFFTDPTPDQDMLHHDKHLKNLTPEETRRLLKAAIELLKKCPFDPASIRTALDTLLRSTGQKPAVLFSLIRLVVSWAQFSPALPETLALIGRERTIRRLERALELQ